MLMVNTIPTTSAGYAPIVAPPWNIIHSRPRQERVAQESLEREGFEVYFPKFSRMVMPRRNQVAKSRRNKLKPVPVLCPLLPGYLFARDGNISLYDIFGLPGVGGLVALGGRPSTISAADIKRLKAETEAGKFDECHGTRPFPHKIGDSITARLPHFASVPLPALVEALDESRELVHLLFDLFGRRTRIVTSYDELRAAGGVDGR